MGWKTILARPLARLSPQINRLAVYGAAVVLLAALAICRPKTAAAHQPLTAMPLHHFDLPCESCHESGAAVGATWPVESANPGRINGDINKLCTTLACHNFDPVLNHPLGVRPGAAIPADMPLDSRSRITCLTCHDTTDPSEIPSYLDVGLERFLRRPSGMEFCGGCHMKMGGTMSEQSHWRFSARAHLNSDSIQNSQIEGLDRQIGDIDAESRLCLTCHDDKTATVPAANESARQKHARRRRMTDHPIGMTYEVTALQKRPGKYRFPLASQSRVRLFNGRVGCGSCHSLYAETEKNLVAPEEMGTLCRKCHKM